MTGENNYVHEHCFDRISTLLLLQIIKSSRGKTTPGNTAFNNPYEGIGPLELTLNNSSTIEITNEVFDEAVNDTPVETVSLVNAPNHKKKMCKYSYHCCLYFYLFYENLLLI